MCQKLKQNQNQQCDFIISHNIMVVVVAENAWKIIFCIFLYKICIHKFNLNICIQECHDIYSGARLFGQYMQINAHGCNKWCYVNILLQFSNDKTPQYIYCKIFEKCGAHFMFVCQIRNVGRSVERKTYKPNIMFFQ